MNKARPLPELYVGENSIGRFDIARLDEEEKDGPASHHFALWVGDGMRSRSSGARR